MFFPSTVWWDSAKWSVPDSLKYLCERWWELLRDWHCITAYSLPCGYILSILEDVADVIDDLLRDISGQLTGRRLINSVGEVLQDFRDTFDELLVDLGQGKVDAKALSQRIALS